MNGKFYVIMIKGVEFQKWTPLSETEYTEREANRELRMNKKHADKRYSFRKKCVYNGPIQVLSIKNR